MTSTTTTPTRYVDGVTVPAAGLWQIDPGTPTWRSSAGTS